MTGGQSRRLGKELAFGLEHSIVSYTERGFLGGDYQHFGSSCFTFPLPVSFYFGGVALEVLLTRTLLGVL